MTNMASMTPGSSKIPCTGPKSTGGSAKTLKVGSGSKKSPAIKGKPKAR